MNNFMAVVSKHKPSITTGIGIGCLLSAVVAAWQLSPIAKDAIEEKKRELEVDKLEPMDTIRTNLPYVAVPVILAIGGSSCVIAGNSMNITRQAAAITACAISETTSQIYRDKVREIVGDKKEKDIHEAAAKEMYNRDYNNGRIMVINGNSTGFAMYDSLTKQKFKSNIEKIHSTINYLNRRMLTETVISMDDYCLAMDEQPMELGKVLGWDIDHGYIELEPFTAVVNEDGEPEIVITHRIIPRRIN